MSVRTEPVPETLPGEVALVAAIVARAVADARGVIFAPGGQPRAAIQAEAQAWLADAEAVTALIKLMGYDATHVLHRIRHVLWASAAPVAEPQLTLL